MITEKDLQEAIAECQAVRNPTASTCIKLAAYYTIQDHIQNTPIFAYSNAASPAEYNYSSDFAKLVYGRDLSEIIAVLDELMETLKVLQPRLYDAVLRKLR